ncbi:RecQ family ATP-dependent DNA helicase [Enterococcus sp. LJL98]
MIEQALAHYFGYQTFRKNQKEIIESLLAGHDTLGILPTGTGKSLCYQLTGYLSEGLVIVVSPLISLMEDQVHALLSYGEKRVVALNSTLQGYEKAFAIEQLPQTKFLFLSPEMLLQPNVLQALKQQKIALFVIDEAHCVSQWGIDFRPEYRNLGLAKKALGNPVTLALTATANLKVQEEMEKHLLSNHPNIYRDSANRENIGLFVDVTSNKKVALETLLAQVEGAGIIYCATRKTVEALYQELKGKYRLGYYHGGLDYQQRTLLQKQFHDQQLQFLIATNAFGMGINKGDIRYVIHYDLPDSMENYIQEIGRAGRDQEQSYAVLLYQAGDEAIHHFFQKTTRMKREELTYQVEKNLELPLDELQEKWRQQGAIEGMPQFLSSLKANEQEKQLKLQQMLVYITAKGCRRQQMLQALGEDVSDFPDVCCDWHGAQLPQKEEQANEGWQAPFTSDWEMVLERMFKE